MSYTLNIRPINNRKDDALTLVEQSCWAGAGTDWNGYLQEGHLLSMNSSGSSGMLRFRNKAGDRFAVAVGIHNYKRWCDISPDLGDSNPLTKLHGQYYDDKHAKNKRLWAQDDKFEVTTKNGTKIRITFTKEEGKSFWADLEYGV